MTDSILHILHLAALYWLIYRLYMRQRAHEAVTLAIAKVLQAKASIEAIGAIEPPKAHRGDMH